MERELRLHIVQGIMGENPHGFQRDMEWEMWWQLNELVEQNGLTQEEADECYQEYLRTFEGE